MTTITLTIQKNALELLETIKAYIEGEKGIIEDNMEQVLIDQAAHCFGLLGRGNPHYHAVTFVLEAIKEATE